VWCLLYVYPKSVPRDGAGSVARTIKGDDDHRVPNPSRLRVDAIAKYRAAV